MVNLATGLRRAGVDVSVILFYGGGTLCDELHDAGVPLSVAGKTGRWDARRFLSELSRLVVRSGASVIYSFLEVPNALAVAGRAALWKVPVVWGIRSSHVDLDRYGLLHRLVYFAQAPLSRYVSSIIFNSEAGRRHARALGIAGRRNRVVPNGIDVERLRFDEKARRRVRDEWSVGDHEQLVGIVARFDPIKNHELFLRAAARVASRNRDVRFACIGGGDVARSAALRELASSLGLGEKVVWAGECRDLPAIYSALDVSVLSSTGEGFPNVIAESMACELPVASTDVGDAREIVGETGRIVREGRPDLLADAIAGLLSEPPLRIAEARARIVERYSIERMIESTAEELRAVAGGAS